MASRTWRFFLGVAALAGMASACAELTHLDIATKRPYGSFRAGKSQSGRFAKTFAPEP